MQILIISKPLDYTVLYIKSIINHLKLLAKSFIYICEVSIHKVISSSNNNSVINGSRGVKYYVIIMLNSYSFLS